MKATQLRALLSAQPWLADEEWFSTFISMVLSGAFTETEAFSGIESDDNGKENIVSGVGIIPISGPLFNRPNFLTEILGIGSTYSALTKNLNSFLGNEEVNKILFDIDSPGGVVSGVNETAAFVKKAADHKPLYSYVGGLGASAAYWLMSPSEKIALDATARVGSIGVVATFRNPEYDDEIEIVNSASPNKRPDLTKESGRKVIIEELDALADVFINTVATNRGVTVKTVKEDFGKGGALVGERAVEAGLTDEISFFSEFLEEIKTSSIPKKSSKSSQVPASLTNKADADDNNFSKEEDEFMDVKTLKAQHPEVYNDVVAEATAEKDKELATVTAERDALKAKADKQSEDNTALQTRVQSLEKSDAIRAEKDLANTANAMVQNALGASKIPTRLHSKVSNQLDHNAHVADGKLDVEGFKTAITAEIAEWEEITSDATSVQGMSFASDQNVDSDDSAEVDETVDRMAGYLN